MRGPRLKVARTPTLAGVGGSAARAAATRHRCVGWREARRDDITVPRPAQRTPETTAHAATSCDDTFL
eukprot:353243-Chlamydomonas_euryale.AAC.2